MAGAEGEVQEQQQQQQKWEGKARAKVKRVRAEQVWEVLDEDFCSFNKWLPTIDICHHVEGIKGKPGLVRYCASHHHESDNNNNDDDDDDDDEKKEMMSPEMTRRRKWCHEKLVSIDPEVRCLSYEVLNNNMGFKSYFATFKVLPLSQSQSMSPATNDGELELELGCEIEWSFLSDPVDGMTCEALSSYVDNSLQAIAHNIEKAFLQNY